MRKLLFLIGFFLWTPVAHGAIATTTVSSTGITVAVSSLATDSQTPTANNLLLLTVGSRLVAGSPNEPTVTGNGLTWVKVLTATSSENRTTVFRSMGASPSTGQLTVDWAGQTQTQAGWQLSEFSGMDTSGSNGLGAIVQASSATSGATKNATATLLAFLNANDATYGGSFWSTGGSPTLTAGAGFSMIKQAGQAVSVVGTEFNATATTTVGITSSASDHGDLIAIEIKVAGLTSNRKIRGVGITR